MTTAHIHDAATGETIVRDMTDDELALIETAKNEAAAAEAEAKAKAAARAAVLAKLGLTADEATALLG